MTEIFNTFSSILSEINVPRTVFDVHSIAQSLMKSKEFDKLRADFFEGLHFIASHDLWDKRTEFITEMDGTDEEFQEIEEKMMKTLQWGERETMSHLEMAIEVSIFQKTPLKFLNSYNFPYKITLEDSEYTS